MRLLPLLLVLALVVCLPCRADVADALLAQAAADAGVPAAAASQQITAAQHAERQAEVELAVGAVRLGLLKARTRLALGRLDDAIAVAEASLAAAEHLPQSVDRKPLVDPLNEVLAQARAVQPGQARPVLQLRDLGGAVPAREVGEPDGPYEKFLQRGVRELKAKAEAERYAALDRYGEDPNLARKVLVYPPDWTEISRRRERFRDGRIYTGPETRNDQGELRQTVIYDVGALIQDVPNFTDAPQLDLDVQTRTLADREALRRGSEIFNGYAEDLAVGIPLLYYFGGIEESSVPPNRGEEARMAELQRIIQQVIEAR